MYLLDTVVISEYLRKKPSQEVIDWLDERPMHTLYLSILTIAELNKGYYKLQIKAVSEDDKKRAERIKHWIEKIERRFIDNIISMDAATLITWSELCGRSEADGKKLPVINSLLTATALSHNLTLVTRNVTDFEHCSARLELYNPYS